MFVSWLRQMLLFTWNLNRGETAFELALSYLAASGEPFLAAFQELPEAAASTALARKATSRLVQDRARCIGVIGSETTPGRVGLFSSPDVRAHAPIADRQARMAIASVRDLQSGLKVIGVHAVDRRNVPAEDARVAHAMLLRQGIEGSWKPGCPLIVMGDFNADPYDREICSRLGIFAIRDSREMNRDWASPMVGYGERMRPLYNPAWHLLPESNTRPGGTFLFNSNDRGIRWRICDQILVSRELMMSIEGHPEILAKIGGEKLVSEEGAPNESRISDHLPLQMRVQI